MDQLQNVKVVSVQDGGDVNFGQPEFDPNPYVYVKLAVQVGNRSLDIDIRITSGDTGLALSVYDNNAENILETVAAKWVPWEDFSVGQDEEDYFTTEPEGK